MGQIQLIIYGIILIVAGALSLSKPIVKWWIEISNQLSGRKTEITDLAFIGYRVTGIILLVLGVAMIVMYFIFYP